MMMRLSPNRLRDDRGVVLIMVLAFAIVVAIGGLTFMQSGQLESRNATQRTQSEQAFWLAEAAYSRATAELWKDASWGVGTPKTVTDTLGGGDYAVMVRDTTISGTDGYRFIVWGTVPGVEGDAQRRIDIATTQKLSAWGNSYSIIAGGDVNIQSAAAFDNISGNVHADDQIDPPSSRTEKSTWDENITLSIPPIYTDPDSFGTSSVTTYYYVRCTGVATVTCEVLDRNGASFFPAKYFTPATSASYTGGKYKFTLSGDDLSWATSVLKPLGGASNVIVNFGEYQTCDIIFDGGGADIKSTIISTRYTGPSSPLAARLDEANWVGGTVTLRSNPTFLPTNGVAMIVKDLVKAAGGSTTYVGSPADGCVVYATGDISGTTGTVTFYGTLLALGDISIGGGTTVVYSSNYYADLPGFLTNRKQPGTSASVTMVHWKELSRW